MTLIHESRILKQARPRGQYVDLLHTDVLATPSRMSASCRQSYCSIKKGDLSRVNFTQTPSLTKYLAFFVDFSADMWYNHSVIGGQYTVV